MARFPRGKLLRAILKPWSSLSGTRFVQLRFFFGGDPVRRRCGSILQASPKIESCRLHTARFLARPGTSCFAEPSPCSVWGVHKVFVKCPVISMGNQLRRSLSRDSHWTVKRKWNATTALGSGDTYAFVTVPRPNFCSSLRHKYSGVDLCGVRCSPVGFVHFLHVAGCLGEHLSCLQVLLVG